MLAGLTLTVGLTSSLAHGADVRGRAPVHDTPDQTDQTAHYWEHGEVRPFVSGQLQVGALNRLIVAGGYGRPHYLWIGAEAQVLTTTDFAAVYSGIRAELLAANLTVGGRYSHAYARHLATPQTVYDDASLQDPTQPLTSYASLDASLWGYIPAGPTFGYWEVNEVWIPGKDPNLAMFEELTRFVLEENNATMFRGGWSLWLFDQRMFFGPGFDAVVTPGRDPLLRVGGNFAWTFTEHLSLMANFTAPVNSPDSIDWFTQAWGIARLTYKMASGEKSPRFP
ncbi:MAG TPA: hypothetical protein VLC09_18260 [Polyangiaceae bacterium]|nr:hypothetical protein [Polyangiaceae bacterium]